MTTVRRIIQRAFSLSGITASTVPAQADEMADALVVYNETKQSLMGDLIGPRLSPKPLAQDTVGDPGRMYQYYPSNTVLQLPPNPRAGCRVGVTDALGKMDVSPLRVVGNNHKIEGSSTVVNMNQVNDSRVWWFNDETGNWQKEKNFGLDDNFEFSSSIEDAFCWMLALRLAVEYGNEITSLQQMASQSAATITRRYGMRGRNAPNPPMNLITPSAPQRQPSV